MFFLESYQHLFIFIQKEAVWQSNFFVKMAGTLFIIHYLSTADPTPVPFV